MATKKAATTTGANKKSANARKSMKITKITTVRSLGNAKPESLRVVQVTYEGNEVITTSMAGHLTDSAIKQYFKPGKEFNIGSGGRDKIRKVISVIILK